MANEPNDPAHIISSLYEAGQAALRRFAALPKEGDGAREGQASGGAADDPMAQFMAATQQLAGLQQELVKQMATYWTGAPWLNLEAPADAAPKDEDKRFAAEAWRSGAAPLPLWR